MTHPSAAADAALLATFRQHFGIDAAHPKHPADEHAAIAAVARAFVRIPFENLTKILARARHGQDRRRDPETVLREHVALGTGGTCFALTALLLRLLRAMGREAAPVLADRRYGADAHCAVQVTIGGEPHLVDPGYLITQPLPLADALRAEQSIASSFNRQILRPAGAQRVELYTERSGQITYRLTFKAQPVDDATFVRAWDRSFEADMLRYPVLTRVDQHGQRYLQRNHLLRRDRERSQRVELDPARLGEHIAAEFRIDRHVVEQALALIRRSGGCE